ncbi:glycoprotein 3-alpha-l-fucosyltransferase a-like [Plakobranchus ocellatus]|uniref:Fucosyltransferase n=1 Tax=Plakobranchus ocellatus TaxID=259542 RepID=A0AAV4AMI2_9GAST|nr:glycoprotein 3-alpha-l-fucosyltransferase a-like [Plakobranchus ocellatus]
MGEGEKRKCVSMGEGKKRKCLSMGEGEKRKCVSMGEGEKRKYVGMGEDEKRKCVSMGEGEKRKCVSMGEGEKRKCVSVGEGEKKKCVSVGEGEKKKCVWGGEGEKRKCASIGEGEKRKCLSMGEGEKRKCLSMGEGEKRKCVSMGEGEKRKCVSMGEGEKRKCVSMGEGEKRKCSFENFMKYALSSYLVSMADVSDFKSAFFVTWGHQSSGLPRKKLVLAVLLVLTAAVFLLVSFYMNDQVSTVTLSGRQWVSRMLVSPQRENLSLSTDDSAYVNHSLTSGISVAKNLSVITARNSPSASVADFAVGGNAANEKSAWNKVFNLTMSYRVDSDVFVPYGRLGFEPIPLDKRANYYEIAKGKTRSVAWFVSNCRTPSRRYDYVQELKRYIDVDIYGGCGIPCKKKDGKCTKELPVKYKFYLSFENSICTDYISEKLYKIYAADMHVIPVTRGGSQYRRYFPENTFIDAAEFRSPRELAEYLKNLGSDLKRYSQMLEYKDQYRWFGGLDSMWCSLCETLSTKGLNPKTYNMKHWFGDGHCSQARDLGR